MIIPHSFDPSLPRMDGIRAATGDGVQLPVMATPKGGFVAFDLTGPAELVLERAGGWEGAHVKPARAGAQVRAEGTRLHVTLAGPRPLLVEGPGKQLLSILAKPPAGEPPAPSGAGRLLRFAAGRIHAAGPIELRDGDVLWLDAGAWVRGQVCSSGAASITIGGRGVLENPLPAPGAPRYRSILLDHCRKVTIAGIHMVTRHGWMITLGGCDDVTVDTVSEEGDGAGTDGIDVVGSRAVRIRRCFLLNGDDNITIKAMNTRSQAKPPAVPVRSFNGDWSGEVRDVLVEDCAFWNDHGGSAMEIGYETRTDTIRNITFRAIDVMAVHSFGSVFGIHNGDRASVEDVLWEDVRVEHHYDKLVDFRVLHSRWNRDPQRGRVRGVVLRRIRAEQSPYNGGYTISVIGGWDKDHRVTDVTFDDFHLGGRHILDADAMDLYAKQAEGITFR